MAGTGKLDAHVLPSAPPRALLGVSEQVGGSDVQHSGQSGDHQQRGIAPAVLELAQTARCDAGSIGEIFLRERSGLPRTAERGSRSFEYINPGHARGLAYDMLKIARDVENKAGNP